MRYLLFALIFNASVAYGQPVSDVAQKHYDRGQAAMELAQTQADYTAAIAEFTEAARLAPNWPDAYLALGQVQEKIEKYADAIVSYKKYLELAPSAENAGTIRTLINKLEYKLEKFGEKEKIMSLMAKWNTPGSTVTFTKTGGGPGGVYTIRQFYIVGGRLQVYIPCYMKDTQLRNKLILAEQTVPVEFDGRIMRFSYDYYNCPTLPEFEYCHSEVKIIAEVISVSPLKFSVKEEWKFMKTKEISNYDAEWVFTE